MGPIDADVILLTCGGAVPARVPAGIAQIAMPAVPGRADLAPVLATGPRRVVVAGTDAGLAAVLLRLLRAERLDVEVGFLPAGRSAAARAWGLPTGRGALGVALAGRAAPVPLVRDDAGGVLVGRGEISGLVGETHCDATLVLRGRAPRLVVVAGPDGIAVRAGRGGRWPDGRSRAVPPRAPAGRGSALGRAVQTGGLPFRVVADGVTRATDVRRWTWYRHTADWLLARP